MYIILNWSEALMSLKATFTSEFAIEMEQWNSGLQYVTNNKFIRLLKLIVTQFGVFPQLG